MTNNNLSGRRTAWVKARRSVSNDNCVELRRDGDHLLVRDSKHPHGPILAFPPDQVTAWLHAARHGEFPTPPDPA